MEVRIGVVYTAREMTVETDDPVDTVTSAIDNAFSAGDALLWLADAKGRRVGIPTDKLAYVEIAGPDADRKVGFGNR